MSDQDGNWPPQVPRHRRPADRNPYRAGPDEPGRGADGFSPDGLGANDFGAHDFGGAGAGNWRGSQGRVPDWLRPGDAGAGPAGSAAGGTGRPADPFGPPDYLGPLAAPFPGDAPGLTGPPDLSGPLGPLELTGPLYEYGLTDFAVPDPAARPGGHRPSGDFGPSGDYGPPSGRLAPGGSGAASGGRQPGGYGSPDGYPPPGSPDPADWPGASAGTGQDWPGPGRRDRADGFREPGGDRGQDRRPGFGGDGPPGIPDQHDPLDTGAPWDGGRGRRPGGYPGDGYGAAGHGRDRSDRSGRSGRHGRHRDEPEAARPGPEDYGSSASGYRPDGPPSAPQWVPPASAQGPDFRPPAAPDGGRPGGSRPGQGGRGGSHAGGHRRSAGPGSGRRGRGAADTGPVTGPIPGPPPGPARPPAGPLPESGPVTGPGRVPGYPGLLPESGPVTGPGRVPGYARPPAGPFASAGPVTGPGQVNGYGGPHPGAGWSHGADDGPGGPAGDDVLPPPPAPAAMPGGTGPPEPGRAGRAGRGGGLLPGFADRHDDGGPGKRPRRRHGRWLAPLISLAVLLVIIAAAGTYAYRWYAAKHANYSGSGFGSVTIEVKPGDGPRSLLPQLLSKGVIKAADPFVAAADNYDPSGLLPGYFRLHKHMNAELAWRLLLNPKSRIQTTVSLPDGMRLPAILALLSKQTHISLHQFTIAAADTPALGLPSYAHGSLEGYLYPDTYSFAPGTTAIGILQQMVTKFNSEANTLHLISQAKAVNLLPGQVITIASLLEVEGTPKYYSQVARVIDNRLNQGVALQLDSTVLYALHKTGFMLTPQQLKVKSPYNTFIHKGLPPGPIDNPTAAAIQAALHPAKGNWTYFVTTDPSQGITKFTNSYSQFLRYETVCRAHHAC
ncbi:MAG: endolytic transglycosylase MltG [Streptosporangiaceae bacterium]